MLGRAPTTTGSHFRRQLLEWLRQVEIDVPRVIDIGAGRKPARNQARISCEEYVTVDHDPETQPTHVLDINHPWTNGPTGFDVGFCIDLMEYVWNPLQAHQNIASTLAPGATLFVAYPFLYPIHGPTEIDCLRFAESGVRKLLDVSGFDVLELTPRVATASRQLRRFIARERMFAARPYAMHIGYLVRARRRWAT